MTKKRTILISGASRGIGRAIAEKVIENGHRVSAGIRNPDILKGTNLDPKLAGEENILLCNYNALEINSEVNWVEKTLSHFQNIDTLIHCAGIFKRTNLIYKKHEVDDINDLFQTNVMGPWKLTKASWDQLKQSEEGRIIVMVSMSGKRSKGTLAGYTMSKFALMGLCQTIRNEGWNHGIRTTAICPGWVNTEMASNVVGIKKEEMTQPEDLASIVNNLIMQPNSCVPFELSVNCNLET